MTRRSFRPGSTFGMPRTAPEPEINLIALIDLLLVVIIFLLVTTTYARWSWLSLDMPASQGPISASKGRIEAAVLRDGTVHLGGGLVIGGQDIAQAIDALALAKERAASAASAAPGKLPAGSVLLIYADRQAPHGAVVVLMDAARAAGISRVAFVTLRR